ncbi:MAG: DUF423 domain-containing protein [Bacteroidetes bacterium HGW-Bacteroidetes-13]|nr:MAG: DUF423 domain-containing protein [Bacteroidetes bacterium HGW-Bacteroidetes-13]
MKKNILITATLLGLTAIVLGAFAAHGLKSLISESSIATFETGVRFQMYHALFLLFIGQTAVLSAKSQKLIFLLTLIGVVCFSGSIYLLATNDLTAFDFKRIALVTPLGGTLLIAAWASLLVGVVKTKRN